MLRRWLRHLIVAPLFCCLVTVLVVTAPLTLLLAAVFSLFVDRRFRPMRAWAFVIVYSVHDVVALIVGFAIWLRLAGRGRMQDEAMQTRHYGLIAWLLRRLTDTATWLLRVHVVVVGSADAEATLLAHDRPVIMLSRHAGPGDSFLLVDELLRRGRRPSIVLRAALQLDPCIDLLGNRLPFCWVTRARGATAQVCGRIKAIAGAMDDRGALLLFPEGGNFTKLKRSQAIRHLLRRGRRRHARLAANMDNVLAPRVAGVLAALAAAPHADVIFVAHSGLAGMDARLWERVPVDRELRVEMFVAAAETIPRSDEARGEWLFSWWSQLDDWVGDAARVDAAEAAAGAPLSAPGA